MADQAKIQEVNNNIKIGLYDNLSVWPTPATHGTVEAAREARTAYRAETEALKAQLQQDLEIAYGLYQHTKAPLLWRLAWDQGHSAGLGEVAMYYDTFSELLR